MSHSLSHWLRSSSAVKNLPAKQETQQELRVQFLDLGISSEKEMVTQFSRLLPGKFHEQPMGLQKNQTRLSD